MLYKFQAFIIVLICTVAIGLDSFTLQYENDIQETDDDHRNLRSYRKRQLSWNINELGAQSSKIKSFSLKELEAAEVIQVRSNSCLNNCDKPLHSVNEWCKDPKMTSIPGTTYWLNEFMAPGHMQLDIHLLQLFHLGLIDRVILQRSPCARPDFCQGIGNWGTFFKGLYTAMVDSAKIAPVPFYVRFQPEETAWKMRRLGSLTSATRTSLSGPPPFAINVSDMMCFERVLRRVKHTGFHHSVSPHAARSFKRAAYSLIPPGAVQLNESQRIVTIAHRGSHNRHMSNRNDLMATLQKHLPPYVSVRLFDTTNTSLSHFTQVVVAAESSVIITTHGAFEGNVVYMRETGLLIEIVGSYRNRMESGYMKEDSTNFRVLSNDFLVFHRSVTATGLGSHKQLSYYLQIREMEEICRIIKEYFSSFVLHKQ